METKRQLVGQQIRIFFEMQSAGFNVVTCGNCGTTLFHKVGEEKINCFGCMNQMDPSDCPDYWYEHDDNSDQYEESDLFEDFDSLPVEVKEILTSFDELEDAYKECERVLTELKPHGYTFEYGLDGVPFNLRKI